MTTTLYEQWRVLWRINWDVKFLRSHAQKLWKINETRYWIVHFQPHRMVWISFYVRFSFRAKLAFKIGWNIWPLDLDPSIESGKITCSVIRSQLHRKSIAHHKITYEPGVLSREIKERNNYRKLNNVADLNRWKKCSLFSFEVSSRCWILFQSI